MSTIPATEVFKEWIKDSEYRAEHDKTQPAFDLMKALLRARADSGLTQQEVADRMDTTQSAVARIEGWSANPSVKTLRKYADATGTRLRIRFEPIESELPDTEQLESADQAVKDVDKSGAKTDISVPVLT